MNEIYVDIIERFGRKTGPGDYKLRVNPKTVISLIGQEIDKDGSVIGVTESEEHPEYHDLRARLFFTDAKKQGGMLTLL